MSKRMRLLLPFSTLFRFGTASMIESPAWARAGDTIQPAGGVPGRSSFLQGLAGGLAGGLIGSLLFGGSGHASPDGSVGSAIGFFEIVLLALLLYLAYLFLRKRRSQNGAVSGYHEKEGSSRQATLPAHPQSGLKDDSTPTLPAMPDDGRIGQGLDRIKRHDPAFREDRFKETVQDLFFRIRAGWTNRSLDGIEGILTHGMAAFFRREFDSMRQKGVINRLENIAIRKVELAEAWQEAGKDYITVLISANLIDYLVDETTREVVEGDKLNPVKFQEHWTFRRDLGSSRWQLSAINQVEG